MNVLLDPQDREIREAVRQFLYAECPSSLVRAAEKAEGFSPALWKRFAALGWPGLALPEAFGGQGLSMISLGVVMEEAGRHIAPIPFHSTMVAALVIARFGSTKQRDLLPAVAAGDTLLSFAVQEESGAWWPQAISTTAARVGDELVLNGSKLFVDGFAASAFCIVVAKVIGEHGQDEGVACVVLDTASKGIQTMALVPTAKDAESAVTLQDVRVPAKSLLGTPDEWPLVVRTLLDYASVLAASMMEGAARRMMEMAVDYVKQREAFGQAIGAFQVIQHMAADMLNAVDGTQLLTHEALWLLGQEMPASVEISQAKSFANDKCLMVARMAQQFHGGIGFIEEFDLNLWYRRIASWTVRYGTTYEHRGRVARALLDTDIQVRLGMPQRLPEDAVA